MKLCVTLAEPDPQRLLSQLHRYSSHCSYIEVRLDYLAQATIPPMPEKQGAQWIATCRPVREGGRFQGEERKRIKLLEQAAKSGFGFLDLEWDTPIPRGLPAAVRIVRSRHFLDSFPPSLDAVLPERQRPSDIVKLAVATRNTSEAVSLLQWMSKRDPGQHIILGMGEWGQITRYLGAFLGNAWTYVSSDREVAPGQFSLRQGLKSLANWKESQPPLYAILGTPLGHSLSPDLHNFLFRHYHQDGIYLPLCIDSVVPFLDWVRETRLDFRGFSVTMPHKLAAARWLYPSLPPKADPINTLTCREGDWIGQNTDREGFLLPLEEQISLSRRRVVVLGTGGVAQTVVPALQEAGAIPIVVGRSERALEQMADRFDCQTHHWSELPVRGQVLVNATPIGQFPHSDASPWESYLLDFELVYDLIYRPAKTRLLETAERSGCKTISGVEMFLRQAALQFLMWTGIFPDLDLMRGLLDRHLGPEGLEL